MVAAWRSGGVRHGGEASGRFFMQWLLVENYPLVVHVEISWFVGDRPAVDYATIDPFIYSDHGEPLRSDVRLWEIELSPIHALSPELPSELSHHAPRSSSNERPLCIGFAPPHHRIQQEQQCRHHGSASLEFFVQYWLVFGKGRGRSRCGGGD